VVSTGPATEARTAAPDRGAYTAVLLFPVLVLVGGLVGFLAPGAVSGLSGWINPLLGVVMFGMGLTLRPVDFALVAKRPLPVLLGVTAQYVSWCSCCGCRRSSPRA
jgi:bile acid:Na+ symporter, BASS family